MNVSVLRKELIFKMCKYTLLDLKTGELIDEDRFDRNIALDRDGSLIEYEVNTGELCSYSVENEFKVVWLP